MKKFSGLNEYLLSKGIIKESDIVEPTLVDFVNLNLVHLTRYFNGIWTGNLTKKEIRRLAFLFGRLSLTLNGLDERERIVRETVTQKEFPLVLLLSGGYAPTVRQAVEAHAIMYSEAKEISKAHFH